MNWTKFNQELRNTLDTGKIIYGTNQAKKECLIGEPKLIIVSSTIAKPDNELFKHYAKLLKTPLIEYPEGSLELGSVCGKPFAISIIIVIDEGKSSILEVINDKDSDKKEDKKLIAKKAKKEEKKTAKKDKNAKKDEDGDYSEEELKSKKKRDEKKAVRGTKVKEEKDKEPKEEDEVPILEDKMFKDIIKIKKK
jgi:large subunit ribosomal protein L30e